MENAYHDLDPLPGLLVGVPASAPGADGRSQGRVGEEALRWALAREVVASEAGW